MGRLRGQHLRHGQARAWISERLDGTLGPDREALLEAHLAACPDCRQAETEYRANRAALRRLPAPVTPRDLPARTLGALEVEARRVRPPRAAPVLQARGARRSGGVAIGSLLTVALVAVVGVLLAGPVVQIIPGPKAGATPFAIAPMNLAYVGIQDQIVRLYHTRLELACPAGNVSCPAFGPQADQVVNLPRTAAVSGLAFDPAGTRAAIAARSGVSATTTFYVVDLGGAVPPGTGAGPGPSAAAGAEASPAATSSAVPSGSAHRTGVTSSPLAAGTERPTTTPRPSPSARAAKTAGATRAATPRPVPSTKPAASATAAASAAAVLASPGQPSTVLPAISPAVTTLPEVEAQAILREVIPTGASAAWSADGSTLAFSAMPADGSLGSDIYTWHPGDEHATALTIDHASTFGSWAGDRIVGSTLEQDPADPAASLPQSFVLDPRTGERRMIEGSSLWLPSVDPTGRYVVAWSGTLETAGIVPVPGQGQLVFTPWDSLDPFGVLSPGPASAPSAAPVEASPSTRPSRTPAESTRKAPATTPAAVATVPAAPSAGASAVTGPDLAPVDPSPQPSAPQLEDWVVAWSPDGSAFAVWEGTAVGVSTGTLSLHAVDATMAGMGGGSLLLEPVAACRAFSIGLDRLAWTTPPDSRGLSELHVLVWGSYGRGELHSGALQQQGIIPAF